MFSKIDEYLDALKTEMKDADPALVQDALADAREHLTTALQAAREAAPGLDEAAALRKVIEEYGTPDETAAAYREVERRTSPILKPTARAESPLGRFFGVYADPRAWSSLLYMFIAFITGVFYFTWAVTGLSLSVAFAIFIFGLPVAILFLYSVRGLALIEGRLVEALLGVRMPRRPLFTQPGLKWLERLKQLVLDKHTWLPILYMLVQFVLGTTYFVVGVTVLSFSLSLMAIPILQELLDTGFIIGDNYVHYILPGWTYPILMAAGFLLWTIFMNVARGVGQLHGRMAKWMLVSE